jgi:hypothetical protein
LWHIFRIYHIMHGNHLCHVRCYMGHASVATHPTLGGLRSGLNEWIIQWMTHKRKSANLLSYSEQWISFHIIYYLLYMLIMQTHPDFSCRSWLQSRRGQVVSATPLPTSLDSTVASMHRQRHDQVTSAASSPTWLLLLVE